MARRPTADPSLGVFETMLVLDGAPVELDAHLRRMATSLDALYGAAPPTGLRDRARAAATGFARGRLRIDAVPAAGSVAIEIAASAIDPALSFPAAGVSLRGFELRGGLGAHKWLDRSTLPAQLSLLTDGDEALEANRANVFAVRDGAVFTPPLDGRILPGVTRAAVLAIARGSFAVEERPLRLTELLDADEVFLTGSLRGIEVAASLDGASFSTGSVTKLLADSLRRRVWGRGIKQSGRPEGRPDHSFI